jgi:hypothetical protein
MSKKLGGPSIETARFRRDYWQRCCEQLGDDPPITDERERQSEERAAMGAVISALQAVRADGYCQPDGDYLNVTASMWVDDLLAPIDNYRKEERENE